MSKSTPSMRTSLQSNVMALRRAGKVRIVERIVMGDLDCMVEVFSRRVESMPGDFLRLYYRLAVM